ATHAGGSDAGSAAGDRAASSSSPSACLHGIFRLGHEQRNAGPLRSACAWYGLDPEPWHSPQSACPLCPRPDQRCSLATARPAPREPASGASATTCSAVRLTFVIVSVVPPPTSPGAGTQSETCGRRDRRPGLVTPTR